MLSTSGAVPKLLALQVFCLVVILSRLLSSALLRRQLPALKIILGVKLALLIANASPWPGRTTWVTIPLYYVP